jgi:hypothetical protein
VEEKKAEENQDGQDELIVSNQNSKSEIKNRNTKENTKLPWKKRKLDS